jgi:hypothetical protein
VAFTYPAASEPIAIRPDPVADLADSSPPGVVRAKVAVLVGVKLPNAVPISIAPPLFKSPIGKLWILGVLIFSRNVKLPSVVWSWSARELPRLVDVIQIGKYPGVPEPDTPDVSGQVVFGVHCPNPELYPFSTTACGVFAFGSRADAVVHGKKLLEVASQ